MTAWTRKELIFTLLWTAFVNGMIASLISIQGITSTSLPTAFLPAIYLALQQIGHFQFFAFIVSLPLIFLTVISPNRKLVIGLSVLFFSAFTVLVFVDYAVFKLYRFHLNGMVWNMITGGALQEIFVLDQANITTASLFIAGILLLQIILQFWLSRRLRRPHRISGWTVLFIVLLIQVGGQSLHAWADAWYKTDIMSQVRFIPLAQPITIKRFLRSKGWAPEISNRADIRVQASGHFKYPLQPLQCQSPDNKPNILFIISDGLRFDMLNPEVMPNWFALAQKSQQFENHISSGNATRFGIFGLFSGLYGDYWFDALNTQSSSVLIDELKQQGYTFGLFANARLTSPEFDRTVFSSIRELIPEKTRGKDVISRELEITRQAKDFFQQNNSRPFFSLVFFDAPHAYVSPEKDNIFQPALKELNYLKLNNDSDPAPFLNRYRNAVHFNDRLTGELLQSLQQQGLMENTIIILTGDHGQEANETRTNSWGHNSNFSRYQVQTPLLVYWPGMPAKSYSQLTSHVDLVPTLLKSVFSCSNTVSDYSNGQSLFDTGERDFVLVKNWNSQAIVNKQQVQVFPKIGPSETYTFNDYQKLKQSEFALQNSTKLMQAISHFYQ